MAEETCTHCESCGENKRARVESGSSTDTTEFFISDDGSDITECLQQDKETRCEGTCHVDIKANESMDKYDQFNAMDDDEADKYRDASTHAKTQKNWKFVAFILGILTLIMIFAFYWEFNEIRTIKAKLIVQPIGPRSFTAISLKGGGQLVRGRKGVPILNWEIHFQQGEIAFLEGKKIHIKKSGHYNVYAQMFFYQNAFHPKCIKSTQNITEDTVMDFGITKLRTNQRIIGASVSLNSCKVACTRHIASMVHLKKNEILTVDTYTSGVCFKMIKERALFGAYLIGDDDDVMEAALVH